jgi:acetaldehyde dehydrogenase/alcohol dehydrogenase
LTRVTDIMDRAAAAAAAFEAFDQDTVNRIVRAVYLAALEHRVELAKLAHEETGLGVWQHKVVKNVIASLLVYEDIKAERTVGVIAEEPHTGMVHVARPIGPVLAFVPVTNPTSTTIYKILIAMKTRNPIVVSPHQAARHSSCAAAEVCYRAALGAGAPEFCVQSVEKPTAHTTGALMSHPSLALILATGTDSLVRRATTSGTPTLGVGPGNVPVYIGGTADIPFAVRNILESKTFDNGTICASEQAVVVKREVEAKAVEEFERQGGFFLSGEGIERVGRVAWDAARSRMAASVVGQPVSRIAERAGVSVPDGCRLLLARLEGVGPEHPLSAEILAPILAFYAEPDFESSIRRCSEITRYGGTGHTAVIYSNTTERVEYFSREVLASRILVNMPSTQGAIGGIYNTLNPSFTLSCGSGGNSLTTDNITARHLLNIHRIARRRPNSKWFGLDGAGVLDEKVSAAEVEAAYNRNS